jgi:prepilin-type N-terminal cleavage/methylation domain-containing protein
VRPQARRGLTLVELLVVIAIVLFLSTFLIANLAQSSRLRAQQVATRALVTQCELAIASYRGEMGDLPPSLATLLSPQTKKLVTGDPSDPRSIREVTFPPFLVLAKEQISMDGKEILDAWGDPLRYDRNRTKGLVWSDNLRDP